MRCVLVNVVYNHHLMEVLVFQLYHISAVIVVFTFPVYSLH